METQPSFLFPILEIPPLVKVETIEILLPTADVPFYTPMVLPPSNLEAEEEIEGEASEETDKPVVQPGIKQIDIPFTDKQMPVPETEILVTATTTAVVSVAATLTATAAFKYVVTAMKPILKTGWKKISQSRKKVS